MGVYRGRNYVTSSEKPGDSAAMSTDICTVPPEGTVPVAGYKVNMPSCRRMLGAPVDISALYVETQVQNEY